MKSLSTLPPGLLSLWYRNQSDEVKQNVRLALGAFVNVKLNSSKVHKAK